MSKKARAKGGKRDAEKTSAQKLIPEERAQAKPPKQKLSADVQLQQLMLVSRALCDPTRVSILRRIANGDARCGDVRECLHVSAATLSHHMKELEHAGLITTHREGRFVNAALDKKVWKQYISGLKSLMP